MLPSTGTCRIAETGCTPLFPIFSQEIINPDDPLGPKTDAKWSSEWILHLHREQPIKFRNISAAQEVLKTPISIFCGLRRYREGGYCFVGKPKLWYTRYDKLITFPDQLLYAVYLSPARFVYDFRAEKIDSGDGACPKDWKSRFKSRVWLIRP